MFPILRPRRIEAEAELLLDLRVMVNNPAFSDVVFVCKDGERVQALRLLLAKRSQVLKRMLMNSMAESNSSKIKCPETSSSVLLSVFEFLYTGTLSDYPLHNWKMSCEVLIASQFFRLPKLERITRQFMHARTAGVAKDLPTAAVMLTEAVEFKAMSEKPDVSLRELVSILSSDWSRPDFVQNLSEDAFQYLLANSRGNCEDDNKLSFEQYLRFRQVVRWSCSDEEIVNSLVPDEKSALSLCRDCEMGDRYKSPLEDDTLPSEVRKSFLQDMGEESRQKILRLMSYIDCRRIHPVLLAKVVEPMKIISAQRILSSLWFHALRREMTFKRLESGWEHGESYCVLEQGHKIQRTGVKIGLAVANVAMSRHYGIYTWRFILEEYCLNFAEFGFICFAGRIPDEKGKLDGVKLSALDHARAYTKKGPMISAGSVHSKELEAMLFCYNASEHTCSLSRDGKDSIAAWTNLPTGTYYPAVCLGNTSKGRVQIQLLSGFDIV